MGSESLADRQCLRGKERILALHSFASVFARLTFAKSPKRHRIIWVEMASIQPVLPNGRWSRSVHDRSVWSCPSFARSVKLARSKASRKDGSVTMTLKKSSARKAPLEKVAVKKAVAKKSSTNKAAGKNAVAQKAIAPAKKAPSGLEQETKAPLPKPLTWNGYKIVEAPKGTSGTGPRDSH